jgi:penicillin-binding protein 2
VHSRRLTALFVVIVVAFLAVEARLFSLQVVRGESYREYAERQRIRLVPAHVARVRILARDGSVLAEDQLSHDLSVVIGRLDPSSERRLRDPLRSLFYVPRREQLRRMPRYEHEIRRETGPDGPQRFAVRVVSHLEIETRDDEDRPRVDLATRESEVEIPPRVVESLGRLAELTGEPRDELLERVIETAIDVARLRTPVFAPVPIVDDVGYEVVAAVETRPDAFRGFQIDSRFRRDNPAGAIAPHTVGTVSQFNQQDLDRARKQFPGWPGCGFLMTLRAGRTGIERSMDAALRGEFGMECIERDHLNRRQNTLAEAPPIPGRDVVLTLDPRLQHIVEDALGETASAAVVIDCRTGDILAVASAPTYDPDRVRESDYYAGLLRNPDRPLFNRAVSGRLPLGSVFKIVTALAALDADRVPTGVSCGGSVTLGRHTFRCHRRWGHGRIELTEAIKVSCNVFFYRTAQSLGDVRLIAMARRLGFGEKTGVKIPAEFAGLLPHRARGGELLNLSIGQGKLLVTPLQVARLLAAVANGGTLVPPRIVRELRPFDTDSPAAERVDDSRQPADLKLSPRDLEAVRLGLYKVVNEHGGTGHKAFRSFDRPFRLCGKTSTAQRKVRRDGRTVRDNVGWFAGYAPAERPRIAFAVAVEHLGPSQGGGSTAGPIARRILDAIPLDLLGLREPGEEAAR